MAAYKIVEIIGTSPKSWEDAANNAVQVARKSIRHMRVAEVREFDLNLNEDGSISEYRVKVDVSFKYEEG
ncbi:dodecin family protein [Aquisalimonas lutea]|uniref:dodecin family protein n=1 Tax=Aquisalimonas lutea TaxID=1327750 RepID=UPI0025B29ADE|nr:dodecin family protein [Aquisalimonas lutea]MDN3517306.1 dodecin family protein [Aquisalimonas lutea]